ncbi:uncharacterized protein LOC105281887 [Ooceraea biroi]|uniref:uncharacterized protein LOC105281887 n=1 Tax=Ooceraea biroi TaxID=2015173 RepID=UPI000F0974C3|nr:uncharacterized protein LOC105281887 [Ooceraea biroi]
MDTSDLSILSSYPSSTHSTSTLLSNIGDDDDDELNENSIRRTNSMSSSSKTPTCSNTTYSYNSTHSYEEIDVDILNNIEQNVDIQNNNTKHHTCVVKACRELQSIFMRKLNLIVNLLTNPKSKQVVMTDETNLLPNFPLSTTEELLQFEREIKTDKDIRKQFVSIYTLFHNFPIELS